MATVSTSDRTAGAPSPRTPIGRGGPPRWHAPVGIGVGVLACLLGLLVLAWLVLFVTHGRFLKHTVERLASKSMRRDVRVAGNFELYFAPINVKFVADGLSVSNPTWASKPNFLTARHINTRISTIRLIFGTKHARWLNLDGAAIDAEWDKTHTHNTWTFGDPNAKGEPFVMPTIERAAVTGTTVRFRDPSLLIATDQTIDTVRSSGTHIDTAIGFRGEGTLRGKPFSNTGRLLSPNSTVTLGRTQLELHADTGPTHLDLSGTLPAATQIEGSDLNLAVRGPNARLLFDLMGVVIPDTRRYAFRSELTKAGDEWRFAKLAGTFGDSDLAGSMSVSLPNDRLKLVADISSRKLDILDVGPFMGYDPQTLATKGATAAATTLAKGTDHPRLLPDAPLRADALKVFDAHVTYKVRTIRAPNLPVSNVSLVFDLDHNLLKLSPLTMDVAQTGKLSADIVLDARGRSVVTDYDIRMSPTPLGRLLKGFGMADAGTTGTIKARIKMKGTGDSVRRSLATSNGRIAIGLPAGTFITSYAQLSEFDIGVFLQKLLQDKLKEPIRINCGLVAFTVRNGVASADPILIDTSKNVMTATGGFSFRDESMNIKFRSRAKKFSVFSGQSPVGIGGYFAAPSYSVVSPQLLGRAGAAVALGVVATPLASVLAFVDTGSTPDTACGPVLSGATAAAQRTEKGKAVKGVGTRSENREDAGKERKKFLGIF